MMNSGAGQEKPMSAAQVLPCVAEEVEPKAEVTHETFVHAVRAIVVPRVAIAAERARLLGAKLVYGAAHDVRGRCFPGAWENGAHHDFLEISAANEESYVQLAGTTIHELAHTLAGADAGHGRAWKAACATIGLRYAEAGGQAYAPDHFDAAVWASVEALPHPSDGRPSFRRGGVVAPRAPRPCPLGIGTRGGRSRGAGSGSRMRLYVCACPEGTIGRKVRVASDTWDATCNRCGTRYARA